MGSPGRGKVISWNQARNSDAHRGVDEDLGYIDPTAEQTRYAERLARRLVRLRKSAAVDADDLISSASLRWWQFCLRNDHLDPAQDNIDMLYRQQVKFAMRDTLRESEPVKITRTDRAKLKAYETPYTVSLEPAAEWMIPGDEPLDRELWMDVRAILERLSERDRLVLFLSAHHGYSFTEIAYALDTAVSTVTRAYHRSIDFIKKNVGQADPARKKSGISTDIPE